MSRNIYFWIESYLFNPNKFQKIISFLLLPITFIYCLVVIFKRLIAKPIDYGIPIISIGNLIVGGSGKTPLSIKLASKYTQSAVILRGYARESSGMKMVSKYGEIFLNIKESGDEAMLLATSLPQSMVIVSQNREEAILKAKQEGAKVIFLDDGFSKSKIKKFDILIKPSNIKSLPFCLPSGAYREMPSFYNRVDLLLIEDVDFRREVNIKNPTKDMILVTAISKPKRLNKFIPKVIEKVYFPDHYSYTQKELELLIEKYSATSILTTTKDAIKMQNFSLKLSILELDLVIESDIYKKIDNFLEKFDKIA